MAKPRYVEEDKQELASDLYSVNLSEEKKKELLDEIVTELENNIAERQQLEADLKRYSDIYYQKKPVKSFPWRGASNTHIPYPATVCDTAVSRFQKAFFSIKPFIRVKPREKSDATIVESQEKFLHWSTETVMKLEQKSTKVFLNTCIDGTYILKLPWVKKITHKREKKKYASLEEFLNDFPRANEEYPELVQRLSRPGEKLNTYIEWDETEYDAPDPQGVLLKDFLFQNKVDFYDSKFWMERLTLNWDDLLSMQNEGFYEGIEALKNSAENQDDAEKQTQNYKYKDYTVYEGIWKVQLEDDKPSEMCLVSVSMEPKVLLRIQKYPYDHGRPFFIPYVLWPKKDTWLGLGLIEMSEISSELMDTIFNQIVDASTLAVAPVIKIRENGSYDPDLMKVFPGSNWVLQEMDDAEPMKMGADIVPSSMLVQQAFRFIEQRTGITLMNIGMESPIDPRAPGNKTIALLGESVIRIDAFIKNLRPSFEELANQIIQDYYQFMPEGLEYRILNDDGSVGFQPISKDDLRLRADYIPQIQSPGFNKEEEKATILNLYDMSLKDPLMQNYPNGRRNLLVKIYKLCDIEDWDQIVPPEAPPNPLGLPGPVPAGGGMAPGLLPTEQPELPIGA